MTRAQYLFALAHLCHVTPAQADDLRIGDFVLLLAEIRQREAAVKEAERGR